MGRSGERSGGDAGEPVHVFSTELRNALALWIDLDEVDAEAFEAWLLTVLPLLPRPGSKSRADGDRLRALALALVEAAQERAVSHFRAAEYFRDNQMLARRVKALEAILHTAKKRGFASGEAGEDPDSDRASIRYLPRRAETERRAHDRS